MKGDVDKYQEFAIDERHWNNSSEYKTYINGLKTYNNFYDKNCSINVDEIIELLSWFLKTDGSYVL